MAHAPRVNDFYHKFLMLIKGQNCVTVWIHMVVVGMHWNWQECINDTTPPTLATKTQGKWEVRWTVVICHTYVDIPKFWTNICIQPVCHFCIHAVHRGVKLKLKKHLLCMAVILLRLQWRICTLFFWPLWQIHSPWANSSVWGSE